VTSLRQIEANRQNALKSTGPNTEKGKRRSRSNALRHGLTAETVVEPLESPDEYRAFEAAIISEYLPQTPVEQQLVRRLASLFWRLRRATTIETGILRMQAEILQAFRRSRRRRVEGTPASAEGTNDLAHPVLGDENNVVPRPKAGPVAACSSRDIAVSYLRLANLDNELIDRLSRYEANLWRQVVQTLIALHTLKRR
jgi:hypothetical protein